MHIFDQRQVSTHQRRGVCWIFVLIDFFRDIIQVELIKVGYISSDM